MNQLIFAILCVCAITALSAPSIRENELVDENEMEEDLCYQHYLG